MSFLFDEREIEEALKKRPSSVRRLYIKKGKIHLAGRLIEIAKTKGVQYRILPDVAFRKKAKSKNVNFFLEVEPKEYMEEGLFERNLKKRKDPLVFAFDGIYDPQNFGNILRSAGCFKLDGIILPKDRTCPITEKVMEISKGGYERVNLVRVTNLPRYLEKLKDLGIKILALDERGEKDIYEENLKGGICVVLGREDGLRRLTRQKCDSVLRIPTSSEFPSLNLATSFAIALYEVIRQRKSASV